MTNYTKGPWVSDANNHVFGENRRLVALCGGRTDNFNVNSVNDENQANTRLISMAPTLLELLKQCMEIGLSAEHCTPDAWVYQLSKECQDAIKKATGE